MRLSRLSHLAIAIASFAAAERRDSGAESLPGHRPANCNSVQSEFTLQLVSAVEKRSAVSLALLAAAIRPSKVVGSPEPPPQPAIRTATKQDRKHMLRRIAFNFLGVRGLI